jgi:hypothetical protein
MGHPSSANASRAINDQGCNWLRGELLPEIVCQLIRLRVVVLYPKGELIYGKGKYKKIRSANFLVIGIILLIVLSVGYLLFSRTNTYKTLVQQYTKPADYNKGYNLGLEAYVYGLPLLVTNSTFQTMTSVNVSEGAFGPVNQFNNVRTLNNSGSTVVVATSATTLSSIAWLDLQNEPQVLHVPQVTDHYFGLAFIDPYTENPINFSTASNTKPGDYVIADPSQKNIPIPEGTERINVDYSRIWIIGATQLKGPDDLANVNSIQDGYTLTPLSKFGTAYQPPAPSNPVTTVTKSALPTGVQFFDMLGEQLKIFPPPARDKGELHKFAEVGIGPGMKPSQNSSLSSDTLRGLNDAVSAGPNQIKKDTDELFYADFGKHNGYLLGGFGQYGTNYKLRAVISQIGLGAFIPHQAIYAMSWSDHDKKPLNGSTNYILHMQSAPPTNEGWSLTLYNLKGAMIPNSINRYALTNTSPLTTNPDGSINFYLQADKPSDPAQESNWLPTASGQEFEITWRLFAPQPDKISNILDGSGWQPPTIQPAK